MSVSSERVKKWRENCKTRMVEAMGGACQCCGYNACNEALAFHHIDPTQKELKFGNIRANPTNWNRIVEELKKSILVCHNCHSEIHAGLRDVPTNRAVFDEKYADYKSINKYDDCPMCGKNKPIKQKFCSSTCAQKNRNKIDWSSIDLLDLLNKHSISELEKMLGVSNPAIYKRRNKLLKQHKLP
jgi:hypothetical protein